MQGVVCFVGYRFGHTTVVVIIYTLLTMFMGPTVEMSYSAEYHTSLLTLIRQLIFDMLVFEMGLRTTYYSIA